MKEPIRPIDTLTRNLNPSLNQTKSDQVRPSQKIWKKRKFENSKIRKIGKSEKQKNIPKWLRYEYEWLTHRTGLTTYNVQNNKKLLRYNVQGLPSFLLRFARHWSLLDFLGFWEMVTLAPRKYSKVGSYIYIIYKYTS